MLSSTAATFPTTTATASTRATRSTIPPKPAPKPILAHGRIFLSSTHAFALVNKQDFQWQDYLGLSDILTERLALVMPAFPLSLGGQGLFNHLAILGATPRDVAVSFNGRSLNDPAFSSFNLEHIPPEMLERAEVFIGSDAALLADNAAGALINLQEAVHNVKRPYSRLWVGYMGNNYGASDGTFSYNLASDLNATVGYRRQPNNGNWQPNTAFDAWNVRASFRWNASSNANLSFSYLFTEHRTGMNGGIYAFPTTATIAGLTGQPLFSQMEQTASQHDFTLTGSLNLTEASAPERSTLAALAPPVRSTTEPAFTGLVAVTLYASLGQWSRSTRSQSLFPADTVAVSTFATLSVGATARVETSLKIGEFLTRLEAGGTLGVKRSDDNPYFAGATQEVVNGFGRLELGLADNVRLSGGLRLALLGGVPQLAFGGKAIVRLADGLECTADISRSFRAPSLAEELNARTSTESHLLGFAAFSYHSAFAWGQFSASASVFYRFVSNPILAQAAFAQVAVSTTQTISQIYDASSYNGRTRSVLGGSCSADIRLFRALFANGNLLLTGTAQGYLSTTDDTPDKRLPALYASLMAQYEYVVGRSVLRLGARVRVLTPLHGERFLPTTWSYAASGPFAGAEPEGAQQLTGNGIDIVAGAEVGNAYIRATYQNALNQQWYLVPVYPQYPSAIRLSVSWTFLD